MDKKGSDPSKLLQDYKPLQFSKESHIRLHPSVDPGRSSGEPERIQNIVIQFEPQHQDTIEVRQKVDQFWKFIRSDPKLKAFKVTPVQGDQQFKNIQEQMNNMRTRLNYDVKLKTSGISNSDATSKDLRKYEPESKEGETSKPTPPISKVVGKPQNKISRKTRNNPDKRQDNKTRKIEQNSSLKDDFSGFPAIQAMQTIAGKGRLTAAFYGN